MAEKKIFNRFYIQSLKLKAASITPFLKKYETLSAKFSNIEAEFEKKKEEALAKIKEEMLCTQKCIDAVNDIVKEETGGYCIEDLLYRDGRAWNLKYPDTVIPPVDAANAGSDDDIDTKVDQETGEITGNCEDVQDAQSTENLW